VTQAHELGDWRADRCGAAWPRRTPFILGSVADMRIRGVSVAAFLLGFGLGAWFGSQRTLRRIRAFSNPADREQMRAKRNRVTGLS
jgi:hypothetical protein